MEITYAVSPSPAKPVPADILQAYEEKYISLEALFKGGNPFDEADAGKAAVEASFAEVNPDDLPF
jgi:hypothetical protein